MANLKLLLLLAGVTAQVMAQAPTKTAEFEVVVEAPRTALPAWLSSFLQMGEPPCHNSIQKSACSGTSREVAVCLAGSSAKLSDVCTTRLFQEALSHGDAELLEMLAPKVHAMLSSTQTAEPAIEPALVDDAVVADEPKDTHSGHHSGHHKKEQHVHPIVTHLRQACVKEFTSGTCSFALDMTPGVKICPRKLLQCLVDHRKQLGEECTLQTRTEIVRISQNDSSPMQVAVSILAWVLMFLALFACCRCCMRCIRMCCCRTTSVGYEAVQAEPVIVEITPSAPVMTEEDELQAVLKLSAAEANGEKIVPGVLVVEQV